MEWKLDLFETVRAQIPNESRLRAFYIAEGLYREYKTVYVLHMYIRYKSTTAEFTTRIIRQVDANIPVKIAQTIADAIIWCALDHPALNYNAFYGTKFERSVAAIETVLAREFRSHFLRVEPMAEANEVMMHNFRGMAWNMQFYSFASVLDWVLEKYVCQVNRLFTFSELEMIAIILYDIYIVGRRDAQRTKR